MTKYEWWIISWEDETFQTRWNKYVKFNGKIWKNMTRIWSTYIGRYHTYDFFYGQRLSACFVTLFLWMVNIKSRNGKSRSARWFWHLDRHIHLYEWSTNSKTYYPDAPCTAYSPSFTPIIAQSCRAIVQHHGAYGYGTLLSAFFLSMANLSHDDLDRNT